MSWVKTNGRQFAKNSEEVVSSREILFSKMSSSYRFELLVIESVGEGLSVLGDSVRDSTLFHLKAKFGLSEEEACRTRVTKEKRNEKKNIIDVPSDNARWILLCHERKAYV
jgi:hypothetical protein